MKLPGNHAAKRPFFCRDFDRQAGLANSFGPILSTAYNMPCPSTRRNPPRHLSTIYANVFTAPAQLGLYFSLTTGRKTGYFKINSLVFFLQKIPLQITK